MRTFFFLVVAAIIAAIDSVAVSAHALGPAAFERSLGGAMSDPVIVDDMAYVTTGAIVTAWRLASPPTAPMMMGSTTTEPVGGWLRNPVRRGDYLYVPFGWQADSGLAVYSIADRAHPRLVARITDYSGNTVAIANGHLFLFNDAGSVFVSALADPSHPSFVWAGNGILVFDGAYVDGNRIITFGRNWLFDTVLAIYDVSMPLAPIELGWAAFNSDVYFDVAFKPPFAVGFGTYLTINDLSDPAHIRVRGYLPSWPAFGGVVVGDYAYGIRDSGLDVWKIEDPDAPAYVGHRFMDLVGARPTAVDGGAVIVGTWTDRLLHIDARVHDLPVLAGEAIVPGGTSSVDIAWRGDRAMIVNSQYGFQLADAKTLRPIERFVPCPDLEYSCDVNEIAIVGTRAYLVGQGSFVIVDVADAAHPTVLGQLTEGIWRNVAVDDTTAYVVRWDAGQWLTAIDVVDPAHPVVHGRVNVSEVHRLVKRGNFVFVAEHGGMEPGGFRVVDVSNRDALLSVRKITTCNVDDLALDASGRILLVTCPDLTQFYDVSNPANPALLGSYYAGGTVAVHGRHAFVGAYVLHEIDFSNPAAPTLVATLPMPAYYFRVRIGPDAKVYAFSSFNGLTVFAPDQLFASGLEAP